MGASCWQKAVVGTLGIGVGGVLLAVVAFARPLDWIRGVWRAPPPINAIIEVVDNDQKLVVLSVGRNQRVRERELFTVHRGERQIGKVVVTKVYEDLACAKIVSTGTSESMQTGDRAQH